MSDRLSMVGVTFAAVLALLTEINRSPSLIWNASESVPIGLYRFMPAGRLKVTDLVVVQPPDQLAAFLASNGYLPLGVPLLKRVLALAGQIVCRHGQQIEVDHIEMGRARERDSQGRSLPNWQGCVVVGPYEVFLMNWQSEQSLDGRYFGLLPISAVIGRALPVWTDE